MVQFNDGAADLQRPDGSADWSDRHCGTISAAAPATARAAYETAFNRLPRWVGIAMALRNLAVRPFGLRTEAPDPARSGMLQLPVLQETQHSYEVGLADRHLTFTLHTELDSGEICLTTRIWFNHWLGRVYLLVVLIPHKIIVRQAIRGLA